MGEHGENRARLGPDAMHVELKGRVSLSSSFCVLEQVEGGYAITAVHLTFKAKVPGADQVTFEELANKAKAGCPVSKLFKAEITLDATLLS